MVTIPRCRKCGTEIGWNPTRQRADGSWVLTPVNRDDRQPHWKRCGLLQAAKAHENALKIKNRKGKGSKADSPGEARGGAPKPQAPQQTDAFKGELP